MGIDEQTMAEIVRRVTSVLRAERIILFGSAAADQMTPDSDIDLFITERNVADPWGKRLRVREALRGLNYRFDIILMARERFEETKGVIGGIAYPANRQGRVIYEAA
jgi:predicted nucleotidyltransferase